ncbi:hypothetical protein ACFVU2_18875 [Leifsonia sp. NPDC058194]|uniref:hypothetical protein n=1 Tax=Leifsonia sp. NPDC058194 TaxID=3346374 RepID=UPI0036DE6D2D
MTLSIDPKLLRQAALGDLSPDDIAGLRPLFVSGALHKMWRNGPIENVHATEAGPSDGRMFRMNTYLTQRIQTIFDEWVESNSVKSFDAVTSQQLLDLMDELGMILMSGESKVAPELTLSDVAGDAAHEVIENAQDMTASAADWAADDGAATPPHTCGRSMAECTGISGGRRNGSRSSRSS